MKKIIPVGSLSYAQSAKRILRARGIWARITKDEATAAEGCVYAVEVREEEYAHALSELNLRAIPHKAHL